MSHVNIIITKDNGTKLVIHQTNIPIYDANGNKFELGRMEGMWRDQFINRIGVMFGNLKLF